MAADRAETLPRLCGRVSLACTSHKLPLLCKETLFMPKSRFVSKWSAAS